MKDVVIIGGGPAGVTASLLFSKKGKSTTLITTKWNLAFSSGAFDLFIPPSENPSTPEEALSSLVKNYPEHILVKITNKKREIIREGIEAINSIYPFFKIVKGNEKFYHYISDMGNSKKSWGALKWVASMEEFENLKEKIVVLPSNFIGRKAKQVVEIINLWTHCDFQLIEVKGSLESYYETLKDPEVKTLLISITKERNENFLLPPIFCGDYGKPKFVMEFLPTFESLNGIWLKDSAIEMMTKNGVEIIEEEVIELEIKNGRVIKAITDTGREVKGDVFIISTGKFLGGGMNFRGERIKDWLGKFLTTSKTSKDHSVLLTNPHPLHSQGIFSIGLKIDEKMRVYIDENKKFDNLFACGMIISNVDPFSWSMGFGFSSLTAYILSKNIDESQ